MTVFENVAYSLRIRRVPNGEVCVDVAAALKAVDLEEMGSRLPGQLSGGQQQRVALARALVIRPRCLLLDEPLSNLDAKLRLEMRAEIRRVCKEFKLTTVYVTHDQKEALSISDRMAIMDAGRILQVGAPGEIYRRPACRLVANFIGETDFLAGKVLGRAAGRIMVETAIGTFEGVLGDTGVAPAIHDAVTVSIRPECWTLSREAPARNAIKGRIGESVYLGEVAQYEFVSAGVWLKILELNPRFLGQSPREELFASVVPEDVVVLVT
jgi:iron(III) transport system ATP-binding protein